MSRDEDRKRDLSRERLDRFTQKVEDRFDKEARAKLTQDGRIDGRRMGKSHRTEGGNPL